MINVICPDFSFLENIFVVKILTPIKRIFLELSHLVSKASKIIIRGTFVIAAPNLNIKHAGSIENYTNTAFTVTNKNLRYKLKGMIGS